MSANRKEVSGTEWNERRRKILAAIVEAYIETGEPVGSKFLTEKLEEDVSSATIRNEMAELAAAGYLEQPHTSAGRIPTAPAFRFYIDNLMKQDSLSDEDRENIDTTLRRLSDSPDRLMEEASKILATSTGYAAVTTTPDQRGSAIRRIELMPISSHKAALLLVTDSGVLRNRTCRLEEEIRLDELDQVAQLLRMRFLNVPLAQMCLADIQTLLDSMGAASQRYSPVLVSFYGLVQESADSEVMLTGQLNLLQHPDYAPDRAKSLLTFLAQREQLADVLQQSASAEGLQILLGSESNQKALGESSIITTQYTTGGRARGTIGLIGPMRMDYASAIPKVEYFAKAVGRILSDMLDEDKGEE